MQQRLYARKFYGLGSVVLGSVVLGSVVPWFRGSVVLFYNNALTT